MSIADRGPLVAPFPYFGGKSRIAHKIWLRYGTVRNYVEPFFGSGAVLLRRPSPFDGTETVNDADGLLCNFWRSVQSDPDAVAEHADWPVNENDLHARHAWLVGRKDSLQTRLEGDPEFYDTKVAGWWVWGICCWSGGEWCSGKGPWSVVDGELVDRGNSGGIRRKRPYLIHQGLGVNCSDYHEGVAGLSVMRSRPNLRHAGRGVHRSLPYLGDAGLGVNRKAIDPVTHGSVGGGVKWTSFNLFGIMSSLSDRLRRVRVCCGDWSRVCTGTPTTGQGLTAVFLDPPYSAESGRYKDIYRVESTTVAHDVREWAIEHGDDPEMRIALCGYEGEHEMPGDWECLAWKASGGYGSLGSAGKRNSHRERVWFSPHCVKPVRQAELF